MNDINRGLYNKFRVERTDGRTAEGEKHHGCDHFVLDLTHDPHAIPAISAYAQSCGKDYPQLAADLRAKVTAAIVATNEFIDVPETKLPNGIVVPAFKVGKYMCGQGTADALVVNAQAKPWVRVNYNEARQACADAGYSLITELQALAIAYDIANQDINWTGGKVGDGKVYQGLHKGTVDGPVSGSYESGQQDERRWHELSNGERIFDAAGMVYTWVFDNVQGDEHGIVAKVFTETSPSIATAPFPSMDKGMGWRPQTGRNWSGRALVRGGYWYGEDRAGVFGLNIGWPGRRYGDVGFRCTN